MANPVIGLRDIRPIVISGLPSAVAKTILTGQVLAAGSVLGVITSGGKLKLVVDANSDGSQVPKYVLTEAVDTTGGDLTGQKKKLLASGTVRGSALVFGSTDTLATHFDELKANGIVALDDATLEAFDNT